MKIRKFEPKDFEKIVKFKLESVKVSFPRYNFDVDIFKRVFLKKVGEDPDTALVVEKDSEVVGYIWFKIKKTSIGRYGVINHLFVDKRYRRQGLATKLIKKVEDYFRKKDIKEIKIEVSKSNLPSLEMNRKLGYEEIRAIMRKKL